LLDGAMGTELDKRGLMSRGRNNLDAQDAVLEIHREYARCGCNALTTNTLTMNRIYIETHNVGVDAQDVNRAGAKLAKECAKSLTDAGADAVGANCGELDPAQMAVVVSLLQSATSLPILTQPNAGAPKLVNEKTVFEMAPAPFAAGIAKCLSAGAHLVGGCCGTTAEHIRAVADVLEEK